MQQAFCFCILLKLASLPLVESCRRTAEVALAIFQQFGNMSPRSTNGKCLGKSWEKKSKLKTVYRHRSIICLTRGWVLKQVKNQTSYTKIWLNAFFVISKLTHRSSLSKVLRLKWFEVGQIEIWPKEIPWAIKALFDSHWKSLENLNKLFWDPYDQRSECDIR